MWFKGDIANDNLESASLSVTGNRSLPPTTAAAASTTERITTPTSEEMTSHCSGASLNSAGRARIEFIMTEDLRNFTAYNKAKFINQMPGEYVVKVYYNGEQVRETKFSIGNNGNYADNGIAKQNNLTTNKIILPVKVMGTLDKWNAVNAKAQGFYGNPVNGLTP